MRRARVTARVGVAALLVSAVFSTVVSAAVTTGPLASTPAAAAPTTSGRVLTADPLPTWQTNGIVWAVEQVGGVVYVGGNFTAVRPPGAPPGTREVPRDNMAAFDARTGALLPFSHSFRAEHHPVGDGRPDVSCDVDYSASTYTCDTVYAIEAAPDGRSVYVGGDFTRVDNHPRSRVAAFDTAGAHRTNPRLAAGFTPTGINGRIHAIAAGRDAVYLGGSFLSAGGQERKRLAALHPGTGAVLPFQAAVDTEVLALALSSDGSRLVFGGDFTKVNGDDQHGIGAVYAATGQNAPWAWDGVPKDSFVTDLVTAGDSVYVAANGEGSWDGRAAVDPLTGELRWFDSCLGATWALAVLGDVLYSGSHAHNCKDTAGGFPEVGKGVPNPRYYRLLAQTTQGTDTEILHWFPSTNGGDPALPAHRTPSKLGPRAMVAAGQILWVGGQFTTVNDAPQQGLTRFGVTARSAAPNRPNAPTVVSHARGEATVTWRGVEDLDDETVFYQVYRGGTLVHTIGQAGKPWALPQLSFTDTGLTPGSTVSYAIRAVDSRRTASPLSPATGVTVAVTGPVPRPRDADWGPDADDTDRDNTDRDNDDGDDDDGNDTDDGNAAKVPAPWIDTWNWAW